jgi:hypothetical protein
MTNLIPQRRWFHPTPGWLVIALLASEGFMLCPYFSVPIFLSVYAKSVANPTICTATTYES